jgi:chaperonin GroES
MGLLIFLVEKIYLCYFVGQIFKTILTKENSMTESAVQTKLKPLGDRVLVKRLAPEESVKGGIILPDSAKKKQETAAVVALGTGKKDKEGNAIPFPVKVGDHILMEKYAGQEVTLEDEEFIILTADDIIAIVEA